MEQIVNGQLSIVNSSAGQLPQHVRQDAAVLVVVQLFRGVDAGADRETLLRARRLRDHGQLRARRRRVVESFDGVLLESGEAKGLARLTVDELEREYSHPNQVRAVNTLERF